MKKIFVLTGEPSGDKLASTAISKIQKDNSDIEYLSVGGVNLEKIGICLLYTSPSQRDLAVSRMPSSA